MDKLAMDVDIKRTDIVIGIHKTVDVDIKH